MVKEKMSTEKKMKLIYSGELILIATVFLVIATLEITRVMHIKDWVAIAFNWVTIFGGLWMIVDFIWVLVSPKRKAKNSLLDKILLLPLSVFLITYDIICFIKQIQQVEIAYDFRLYMMTSAFYYIAVIYMFEGIYHYFRPIPSILIAVQEEEEEARKKEAEKQLEENKKEEEPHE